MGTLNTHVFFDLVGSSIGWPAFLLLRFSARPCSGLEGEAGAPTFFFLTELAQSDSVRGVFFWSCSSFVDLFWKFLCVQTYCLSPCRVDPQNPIPVCRIVVPKILVRRVEGFCWALRGPYFWQRSSPVKAEGNYLIPLVVPQISWNEGLGVSSLHALWRAFACLARWVERITLVNPPT